MIISPIIISFGLLLLTGLIALSWTDVKTYRLPDKLTFPLMAAGLIYSYLSENIIESVIGLILGYSIFVAIEYAFKALRGKDGLGRGDAKLLAVGGAWCGWLGLPFIVLIASGFGLVAALMPTVRTSAEGGRIPFGPFLALGIFMVWTANSYVQTIG